MRIILQRCSEARVTVDEKVVGEIAKGYVVLVGFSPQDTQVEIEWMAKKVVNLRLFSDAQGAMNLALPQVGGSVLVVSQFTLYANAQKGNRPSFMASASGEVAEPMYHAFITQLQSLLGPERVAQGEFGADMEVHLVNSGPVTICLER